MTNEELVIEGKQPIPSGFPSDLPALPKSKIIPPNVAKEQAFYAASVNPGQNGFKQTFNQTKFDLDTTGESEHLNNEMITWKDEQEGQNHQIMSDILADPNISVNQKKVLLNTYNTSGFISNNLRDKYVQKTAAIDNSDTKEDRDMQEFFVNAVNKNFQANKETQDIINNWGANLDSSTSSIALGIARDFIPGIWAGSNAASAHATAKRFGFSDAEAFKQATAAFFAGGSYNKQIADIFENTLDPEEKRDFVLHLLDAAKEIPGTDYNQWEIINQQLLDPSKSLAGETFFNLISVADAAGIGKVIRNPIQWLKGLYTFKSDALSKKIMSKVKPLSATVPQAAKVEPTMSKVVEDDLLNKSSNEPTGAANGVEVTPNSSDSGVGLNSLDAEVHAKIVQPQISPMSPMGLTKIANPKQARELSKAAIMDDSIADAAGTSKGEIIGSNLLPKLDDDFIKNNPDLSKDILEMDRKVNELFNETNFDPFLVNVTERADDKARLFKSFSETHGAYYQQANSSFRESLGNIEGKARYGRNADYGFKSIEDAQRAEEQIKQSFISVDDQTFKTNVIQDNGQFFVEMDWKRTYDPFSSRMFGIDSANASFAGVSINSVSRSALAKHVIPNTMRLDEWVTKGAFNAAIQADRVGKEFLDIIKNEVRATPHKLELQKASEWTLENQKWMDKGELSAMFPNLNTKELNELHRGYSFYKRLTDYHYLWSDRKHTRDLLAQGFNRGIYDDTGKLLGYAHNVDTLPTSTSHVWDFEAGTYKLKDDIGDGVQLVKLHEPIRKGDSIYRYATVNGSHKLDILPQHTLPKIEGYITRKNIEPWYIKSTPKSLKVDGSSISNPAELSEYTKVIGAGRTEKEAQEFARRLQEENPNAIIEVKPERGDIGDSILTDYKVYKEMTDYGRKRGERLPTLHGQARLEDPLVAQTKAIQSAVRLNAWGNYQEIFQKNFISSFGDFLPRGEFPNVLTDLKIKQHPTVNDLKRFQVAQRLFEQYANQQYKINYGDEVWKNTLHKLGDVIEDANMAGLSEKIREVANKGNLPLKSVKSLANTLFINLNSMAQWVVQPQSILEFAATSAEFRRDMHMLPGLLINMLSRGSEVKPYKGILSTLGKNISDADKSEFDAIANAMYKSGLPQSVDMNMMIHGGLDDMNKALALRGGEAVMDGIGKTAAFIPDKVNKLGKAVGYTPAQMLADMAGWLYARGRWQKLNPGKNWNTPENIAQITADGWDIMGSMHTRAGAMPYQDGFMSLFFQFQAILHKQFFQVFSSKTLKKAPGELIDPKAKLAAARMAIYGVYGIPAYALVDNLVKQFSEADSQADWERWKGGMLDATVNTMIDLFISDPDDSPSDLAISNRIGPLPETVPYYDMLHQLAKFGTGDKSNARLPFMNAVGSVYESVNDFTNLFRATNLDTEDALKFAIQEAAELTSGYKNYAKARMAMEMSDKMDKMGNTLGLHLSYSDAIAQMFGIITREELSYYKMNELKREREDFIEQRATEIHQGLLKLKGNIGSPDYIEFTRRLKVLNSFTPQEIQDEIHDRVLQKDRDSFMTKKESILMYMRDNAKQKNDKYMEEMEGYLKSSDDPVSQMHLKRLIDNNIIKP